SFSPNLRLSPKISPALSPLVGPVQDASQFIGTFGSDEAEESITINPTNPNNIVVVSNATFLGGPVGLGTISAPPGGLMISYSFDNGANWHPHYFATGDDRFISGCCDPSAVFDRFGNLWFSYLDGDADEAIVMLSTDGGVSYKQVADFKDVSNEATGSDQPKLAVGANSIF